MINKIIKTIKQIIKIKMIKSFKMKIIKSLKNKKMNGKRLMKNQKVMLNNQALEFLIY